jgi:hypothetical protein
MNINFNYGEHFYDNCSFFISVLIAFIGAFFGFLFALLINRWFEKKKEKQHEDNIKNLHIDRVSYLLIILRSTVKTITQQVGEYSNFGENIKRNPLKSFLPIQFASYDHWRLRNLDSTELFDSYSNFFKQDVNKTKNYKNIFSHGDFLHEKISEIKRQNERHRRFKSKDEIFVRDCFDKIFTLIFLRCKNYRLQYDEKASKIPEFVYLSKFETIYKSICKDTPDFARIKDEYFSQLHNTVHDNIADTNFADKIFPLVKSALSRLKNIEFNADEFADDMKRLKGDTKESLEFLSKQIIEIEKKIESH